MASSQIAFSQRERNHIAANRDLGAVAGQTGTGPGMFATLDQTTKHRDPKATLMAIAINGTAVACLLWLGTATIRKTAIVPMHSITLIDPVLPAPPPPRALPKVNVMSGGGGRAMATPVSRGNPPKLVPKPVIMAAMDAPRITPKLAIEPTVNVQPTLKMGKVDAPNIGMPEAHPAVAVSMGNGSGAGLGAGFGDGMGSGSGGNYGGGVFKVGGGVAAPVVVSAVEPGFTEEARQAHVSGKVQVYLQVSPEGRPMHVRVVKGLGMGLDQKALEAVRQYRFKPAMKDGHPVTVEMNIDVNFQIL